MKFNRILLDYVRNWATLNNIDFRFSNDHERDDYGRTDYSESGIIETTWKFIRPNTSYDIGLILKGVIVWDEVEDEPLALAEKIIDACKAKMTAGSAMTAYRKYCGDDVKSVREFREKMLANPSQKLYGSMDTGYTYLDTDVPSLYPKSVVNKTYYDALYREYMNRRLNSKTLPSIDRVIFNDPATIVFWKDGSKTIVKAQDGEVYDDEKGLAMAISKRALGNQGNYYNTFDKYLIKSEEEEDAFTKFGNALRKAQSNYVKDSINEINKESEKPELEKADKCPPKK